MVKLEIRLISSSRKNDFSNHLVTVSYIQLVSVKKEVSPFEVTNEITEKVTKAGQVTVIFPEDHTISPKSEISIDVKSPDGESLITEKVNSDELEQNKPITIKVEPAEFFPIENNTDQSFTKPKRLRGLVVDSTGQGNVNNKQVVLWATKQSSDAQPEIVGSTRTDAQGYFSINFPLGSFSNAEGMVNGSIKVPIRLNDDGSFTEKIVLGAEIPKDEEEERTKKQECNCKSEDVPRNPDNEDLVNSSVYTSDIGGRCVDITKPNRVLEEFDYYSVVRTTEPVIKGITIKEPPKINLADIIKIMTPALVMKTTERSTTPSSRSMISTRGSVSTDVDSATTTHSVNFAAREFVSAIDINIDDDTLKKVNLDTNVAKMMAHDPDGFTLTRFASAEFLTNKTNLVRIVDILKHLVPGRGTLSCNNPADWDDEPTFYQSCTIAHGHILHFKQEWVADGYSFGDLLYSLPLAPCQKKQIAVLDWDRRESATRRESLEEQEFLSAQLQRDRDISEMANAMVRESMSGGSSAKTGSFGGGLGIGAILGPVGGLLGIGGGKSKASSKAWQKSSRNTSANSLQQLRDSVMQASSAVRNQRSTVIQTVRQGESFRVETEVVANHNHCHAITMEYFEVLRHFLVKQRLADVQECLLVPFLMTRFDSSKALRWRESLNRFIRNRRLRRGFDALQRIKDNYVGSNMPVGSYADENLEYLDGFLRITFRIQRPRDDNEGNFLEGSWGILSWLGISPLEFWERHLKNQQNRDEIFAQVLGPRIAEEIVNGLRVFVVLDDDTEIQLPIDPTLVSDFHNDRRLYVSLRLDDDLPSIQRKRIKFIKIGTIVDTNAGPKNIDDILPESSKILVNSGQMRYRTEHFSFSLFNQSRIQNDLSGTDGVLIFTPLNWRELRRPRDEDKEFASSLIKHLNDHLEYYHRVIWWLMDPQRRYMLLDGFIAPNSGGKSVVSVVENNLIGIIGNCLVLPVSSGSHLDPTFKQNEEDPIDLLEHYQPTTPVAPARIAVPTKGVFAESVMGACNSCEKKDDSRFWRFEESPCSDVPTPIQPISTDSRRSTPPDLTAKDFPSPLVAFQNVPQAPDPQGFGSLLQLLSNPNLFRDITGLTENQRNAIKALQSALGTAEFFGGKAANLALQGAMNRDVDKALDKINEQHESGAINDQQRSQLTEAALRSMIGGGTEAPNPISTDQVEQLTNTAGANDASVSVNRPGGETVEVNARNEGRLEDSGRIRRFIVLQNPQNSSDSRSFFPSRNDKSGIIELVAEVRNLQPGDTFRWTRPDPADINVNSPTSLRTRIQTLHPGRTEVDFTVRNSSGTAVESTKIQLSVPQFVTINEDAGAFDAVLTVIHLDHVKNEIIREAKEVCDHLLGTSNVRTIWRIGSFSDTLPGFLPASHVTVLTIRGEPPAATPNRLGITNLVGGAAGANVLNETIDIFPGAYDNPPPAGQTIDNEVDVETQALILELESRNFSDPDLETFAIKVYGRLLGETMAHEIVHSLLAFDIPTGHNNPAIANDLMNHGGVRTFRQRTGIEDTSHTSPVDPNNFTDHGIISIGGIQAVNQARIDGRFPVPPSFT
ncbi:hypothetical protein [Nitrosopumilus sp.]|uniref:hypothetical protein n=1 Tax=Nitrosopumilus sp. TaxID=2024843 RepID=UPI003B5A042F